MHLTRRWAPVLASVAIALSVTSASASLFRADFSGAVNPNAGCGVFDLQCTLALNGMLSSPTGQFSIVADADVNQVIPSADNEYCLALTATVHLTFGGGRDVLVLVARPATDRLCAAEPIDPSTGLPLSPTGPWPLLLSATVDPLNSTGMYFGATGTGALHGTWLPADPTFCPDCTLHLSEPLNITLTHAAIPDLTLIPSGEPCLIDCGPGPGPSPDATPELGSLALFGSALVSFGGYVALRRRARPPSV
jgi:hypothetical protein